jgi:hypothetical protein
VARLLSTTIVAAARIRLNVTLRRPDADSMARDYLPKDAVEQLRRNRERREFRFLPREYRDRGGVSRTILDGITRSTDRELGRKPTGIRRWFQRLQVRVRAWHAANHIATHLHARAGERGQALAHNVRVASGLDSLIEEITSRNERGLECLELRQEYARKIQALGLPTELRDEASAALDAVVKYHLALALLTRIESGRSSGEMGP